MREADGAAALALWRISRMFGISGLRRNQAASIRAGEDRSRMSGMQRGRDSRAPEPARKVVLRMRPLSEVQVRGVEQSRAATVSLVRRDIHGGKRTQAHGNHLAMRQQGMRLQTARARVRATGAC